MDKHGLNAPTFHRIGEAGYSLSGGTRDSLRQPKTGQMLGLRGCLGALV